MARTIYKACVLNAQLRGIVPSRYVLFTEDDKKFALIEFKNNTNKIVAGISCTVIQKDAQGKVIAQNDTSFMGQYAKAGETFGNDKQIALSNECELLEITDVKEKEEKKKRTVKVTDCTNKFWGTIGIVTILMITIICAAFCVYFPMYQQVQIWEGDNVGTNTYFEGLTLEEVKPGQLYIKEVSKLKTSVSYMSSDHGIKGISNNAINSTSKVKEVRIYGLKNIESGAIANCSSLQFLDLASDKIESGAISGCQSLSSVYIETKTIKNSTISSCNSLYEIQLYNVEKIEAGAFSNCANIARVKFYNTKPKVEKAAFANTANITFYYENTQINYSSLQ